MPLPAVWRFAAAGALGSVASDVSETVIEKFLDESEESTDVDSSFIVTIAWAPPSVLTVTMRDGRSWSYARDKQTYRDFIAAPSKGQFFNARIR